MKSTIDITVETMTVCFSEKRRIGQNRARDAKQHIRYSNVYLKHWLVVTGAVRYAVVDFLADYEWCGGVYGK